MGGPPRHAGSSAGGKAVAPDTAIRRPLLGYPTVVLLPGLERTVWWGQCDDDDVVAAAAGRVMTWPTPQACRRDAARRRWEEACPGQEPAVLDLRPAAAWLAGRVTTTPDVALLDAWNLAGDVAHSTGTPWADRGALADVCHAKLTFASVSWTVGRERWTPRWSPRELWYLRRRTSAAVSLLRAALTA